MTRIHCFIAGAALGAIALVLLPASPVEAGTCSLVATKARAGDPATATTRAQIKLTQRIVRLGGGKARDNKTSCRQGPFGAECKVTAVVCP